MNAILVTGGAGYIGSHTVRELQKQQRNVVVLDNLSTGHRAAVGSADFYQGDIGDRHFVQQIIQKHQIDSVIHFAAKSLIAESIKNPEVYYRENATKSCAFFENVIQAGVRNIVFSSTAAVYGLANHKPIQEKSALLPINPYGESKLMVERYLQSITHQGVSWIALRYFNAAGASLDGIIGEDHRSETHLIPLVLQTALGNRQAISIFGDDYPTADGTCIRDYIHVVDLAQAHLQALQVLDKGYATQRIYNVGTGFGYSVKEIIETAEQVTKKPIPQNVEPRRIGDPPVLVADSQRLKQDLDWEPRYSDLQTIIQSAWTWHQANPNGYGH